MKKQFKNADEEQRSIDETPIRESIATDSLEGYDLEETLGDIHVGYIDDIEYSGLEYAPVCDRVAFPGSLDASSTALPHIPNRPYTAYDMDQDLDEMERYGDYYTDYPLR